MPEFDREQVERGAELMFNAFSPHFDRERDEPDVDIVAAKPRVQRTIYDLYALDFPNIVILKSMEVAREKAQALMRSERIHAQLEEHREKAA